VAFSLNSNYVPDDFVVITIHASSWAIPNPGQPDYRTAFGDTIHNYAMPSVYPSGSINRRVFYQYACTPGFTPISRLDWGYASDQILLEPSPVNIGSIAHFDSLTNELTVDVELYFTDYQEVNYNLLNVAVLQDNILGPQEEGGSGAQWTDSNYQHNNMLRHMMTGYWGDTISTISPGTLFAEQFNWTVPSDINGVPIVLGNLKVVVFIDQDKEETLNVIEVSPDGLPIISTAVSDLLDLNKRRLVRVVDVLGREVKENKNALLLYIYDDGTVEKKIISE
jgi:hypothetical protein